MIRQRTETKTSIRWIIAIQYLFLLYYLSYSDSLMNNDILLVAVCLILLAEIATRIIRTGIKISACSLIACMGSVWAFTCSFVNGSGLGSAVTQATLLISICLFAETKVTPSQWKKIITHMTFILSAILILYSAHSTYRSFYTSIIPAFSGSIKVNPNCIAMLSFFWLAFAFSLIEKAPWRKQNRRFLQGVIAITTICYIYLTSARTSILACIAFLAIFTAKNHLNNTKIRSLFLFGLAASFLIVFIYVAMYSSDFLAGEEVFGKGLYTGRQAIWAEALDLLKENWIFGFSNKITLGPKELLSAHNSLLAIACHFGILGLLYTVASLYISFKKIDYKMMPLTTAAILASLIIMGFETLITDWSLLIPFCILFIQSNYKEDLSYDS